MKTQSKVNPNAWYGWRPDGFDGRDKQYFAPTAVLLAPLPVNVSLRAQMPAVWNQGQLGSCTGHGILACSMFVALKQWLAAYPGKTIGDALAAVPMRSRLGLYYLERALEGTVASDAGAQIRDGIKCLVATGCGTEKLWPYIIAKFTQKPPAAWYKDAGVNQLLTYARIPDGGLTVMKQCLAAGYPFTFGFTVYESFESAAVAKTGLVPMPQPGDRPVGGHCVAAVGYDDASGRMDVRNSWGADWGDMGYCKMPYEYFQKRGLVSDCWTLRSEETG